MTITQNFESATSIVMGNFGEVGMGQLIPTTVYPTATSPISSTFYDSEIEESTATIWWNEYFASPRLGATITNLNPEFATLESDGRLTRISDGVGAVEFNIGQLKTRRRFDVRQRSSGTRRDFLGYTTGTVPAYLEAQVAALADSDPTKRGVEYFSTINHTSGVFVKNSSCWARAVDISCLSIGTGGAFGFTTQRPGTLITPRHVVVADHYKPNMGEQLRFLTPDLILRTVTVTGQSGVFIDQRVLVLSADVTGCTPAKVSGDWMTTREGDSYYSGGLALSLDKSRRISAALIGHPTELRSDQANGTYNGVSVTGQKMMSVYHDGVATSYNPFFSDFTDISFSTVGGDSGSPCFAVVNGDLVVLTCWFTANSGPCSWMGDGSNRVLNQMILDADANAGISTGYTVTVAPDPIL